MLEGDQQEEGKITRQRAQCIGEPQEVQWGSGFLSQQRGKVSLEKGVEAES